MEPEEVYQVILKSITQCIAGHQEHHFHPPPEIDAALIDEMARNSAQAIVSSLEVEREDREKHEAREWP
jgi:hypothetical protein